MVNERILVVDDEANARRAIATLLKEEGFDVREAPDGEEALGLLADFAPAVVLTDMRMPRMDGLTLMRRAREGGSDATFVVMTAFASVEAAVEAMRAGAENYLTKPLDIDAVLVVLGKTLETRRLRREAHQLRERVAERFRVDNIVGDAPELQGVYALIQQAAPTKATILILGESGTGKELVAQALHNLSPRKERPFVRVHCAALSEGLLESELFGHERGAFTGAVARKEGRFELADGGTLFLDEIGEISPAVQVKLLRVLQSRDFERVGGTQTLKVDVRIVAATHRDLQAEVKAGRFREDLYYRLNVVAVTLPPLRRRKGDIPALVSHFLERCNTAYGKQVTGLAPGTLQALMSHDWPGNIRELENAVERAVVLARGEELTADDLPPVLRGPRPSAESSERLIPGASLAAIEREAILRTLEMVEGSTSRAAEVLGISVRKIQYKLKAYAGGGTGQDPSDAS
ncbi:sigma-54-dependent Fis family transcriptional regulator [Corallococcus sp. CA047B]|uniref:sigma-54-dependent transcriptional regulator n=1 Tax=Corallococcus sp. CA047B TaxID=2316729 RepID=UPI000EA3E623|nr:sigma-54 dependent transcriptional regulator [Corallococcus sp. CA047B]RKH18814.1 sigma-54-dependent Fis family transcriptional regulator [Corallococcus sp. CA047B]